MDPVRALLERGIREVRPRLQAIAEGDAAGMPERKERDAQAHRLRHALHQWTMDMYVVLQQDDQEDLGHRVLGTPVPLSSAAEALAAFDGLAALLRS